MPAAALEPRLLFISCLSLLVIACSSSLPFNEGMVQRLNNRGPVALSANNPYLAANLLLSKESERSPELAGFLKHRGIPTALEVKKSFFSPTTLLLFYPEQREYFELESDKINWIIRGPYPINVEKLSEVVSLTRNIQGQPNLQLPQEDERLPAVLSNSSKPAITDSSITDSVESQEDEDPFIAGLKNYESRQESAASQALSGGFRSPSRPALESQSFPNLSGSSPSSSRAIMSPEQQLDRAIDLSPQIPAELTPRGDLVHYVTSDLETVELIARWYTKDRTNAERIARINKLSAKSKLQPGDSLIIPSYLIRNTRLLGDDAIKLLNKP